jgi:sigma-E factor negative regulatory protein RseB
LFLRRSALIFLFSALIPCAVVASDDSSGVQSIVAAENSARVLLDRMSHSFRELNYQGIFTFQRDNSMESMRISHSIIDGKEYERLEYLDGKKRDIVRGGHDVNCLHPGHQLLRSYPSQYSKFNTLSQGDNGMSRFYRFDTAGVGRVAGRKVIKVNVNPIDSHRYGYRLAIDAQSGLLLSSKSVGTKGRVLEHFHFVEIVIGKSLAIDYFDSAENSFHAEHIEPIHQLSTLNGIPENSWLVNWLPGGFTPVIANLKYITGDMVTYTDGLTVFSVFLEKNIAAKDMAKGVEGSAQRGATTAFSRALLLNGHPHRVTVVGEIPYHTAQRIAQSITMAATDS